MQRKVGFYIRSAIADEASVLSQKNRLLGMFSKKLQKDSAWGEMGDFYIDNGVSGMKRERPALNKLFEDIRQGKGNTIFVKDEDRLSRNFSHLLSILEELRTRHVEVYCANGLTLDLALERTMKIKDILGNKFEGHGVQKDSEQIGANTGTISEGSRS